MSDEFSKINFSLIWDELNDKNEQQATKTMELTLSQFQEQYAFDPSDMFTNEIELTPKNETSPSTNFGYDAPSSSNVIPPALNYIPDMPDNKEFLYINLTDVDDIIVQNENKRL
ncbi:hypothetical protein DPMN_061378 [Dreissena polymorpha]|uniref:Uncharacterized protein n=1 Tax=Dreissena polymorpha TaxID=45954 RepID=A0A9D4C6W9_DREPO|nr:hypothetical protein DPMN_061378 [Dreissena polymorpha]